MVYVVLYVQSRIVLLPDLCALDVCCPSLGLYLFDVNRTRCTALWVGLYVQSRTVLLPGPCALDVWCPSLGSCRFEVRRSRRRVRGPIYAVPDCTPARTLCARRVLAEPRVVFVRR